MFTPSSGSFSSSTGKSWTPNNQLGRKSAAFLFLKRQPRIVCGSVHPLLPEPGRQRVFEALLKQAAVEQNSGQGRGPAG